MMMMKQQKLSESTPPLCLCFKSQEGYHMNFYREVIHTPAFKYWVTVGLRSRIVSYQCAAQTRAETESVKKAQE